METFLVILFVFAYVGIVLEHKIHVDKAASALMGATLLWLALSLSGLLPQEILHSELSHHLSEIAEIVFFLMGAMTIVELIDVHRGFDLIQSWIKTKKLTTVLWIVSILTFFLSSVLDNLTTAIVMTSILRKLVPQKELRMWLLGMVIIAANAGGAWSPIGDVTSTMLWVGGQISTWHLISQLIVPSLVCALLPVLLLSYKFKGILLENTEDSFVEDKSGRFMLVFGLFLLVLVPVFKVVFHLPPYLGMLFSVATMWFVVQWRNRKLDDVTQNMHTIGNALQRIDMPSILFFLGILLSVSALQSAGILRDVAQWLDVTIGSHLVIVTGIGIFSAIVDNVPLVAAAMGMYSLDVLHQDHFFWELLAYCAGTGGSMLIIGSAAGVAVMGMEKIDFFWYLKKMTPLAAIGYFGGVVVFCIELWIK